MFFNKKSKNRRFERANVLDVKLHSKHVRAGRVRRFSRLLGWTVALAVLGLVLWRGSDWGLKFLVYENPTFAVRKIDVETDGIIPREQLRTWAGVREGDSLFGLDLLRIKRDLELNSLIQHAAVDRVLPGTLWIRVTEREPVAQVTAWRRPEPNAHYAPFTFYFDEAGHVLMPSDLPRGLEPMTQAFDHLPRITGDLPEITGGRRVDSARVQAALRLITEFEKAPVAQTTELFEIDISVPQTLEVTTRQSARVTFGFENIESQLARWLRVHEFAHNNARSIATLDLSVSNNVPVRWFEVSVVPSAPPRQVKPSPYKKKHV